MKKINLFFSYVKEFIEFNRLELKSTKTIESYREGLDNFRKYLLNVQGKKINNVLFDDICDDVIRNYLKWIIDNGNALSTRNSRLAAIKQYIKFCSSKNIELVPLELSILKIKCKTVRPKKNNWISKNQITLILDQCSRNKIGIRDRFIMLFLFSTGARLSEMLDLKIKDIVLENEYPYIIVTGKGNKTRVVPLTEILVENLKYYLNLYHNVGSKDNYLFYTVLKGQMFRMSDDNVQRIVKKYGDKARMIDKTLPNIHPHIFRHSFGAIMYRQGLSLPEIAKLMGHEQLSTSEIYAETDVDMLNKALSKISNSDIENNWDNLSEDDKRKVMGLKK